MEQLLAALGVSSMEEALTKIESMNLALAGEQGANMPVTTPQFDKPAKDTSGPTVGEENPIGLVHDDEEDKNSVAKIAALSAKNRGLEAEVIKLRATQRVDTGLKGRVEELMIKLTDQTERTEVLENQVTGAQVISLVSQGRDAAKLSAEMIKGYDGSDTEKAYSWFKQHPVFKGDIAAFEYFLNAAAPIVKLGSVQKTTTSRDNDGGIDDPAQALVDAANKIKLAEKCDTRKAYRLARKQNPELVELLGG